MSLYKKRDRLRTWEMREVCCRENGGKIMHAKVYVLKDTKHTQECAPKEEHKEYITQWHEYGKCTKWLSIEGRGLCTWAGIRKWVCNSASKGIAYQCS